MKRLASRRRALCGFVCAALALAACTAKGYVGAVPPENVSATDKCKSDHDVKVNPCSVVLTDAHPKAKVTATGPKGGTFIYKDQKCTAKDFAKIEGRNDNYLVTGGTVSGKCSATFIDRENTGKVIGTAILSITNFTRNHCPPSCLIFAAVARRQERR